MENKAEIIPEKWGFW